MTNVADLLIELGTEELPPLSLRKMSEALGSGLASALADAELGHGEVQLFATPRRLAVRIPDLAKAQPARDEELRGPPVRIAFDDAGKPTQAAVAFAKKCGVAVSELQQIETDKGAWLVHQVHSAGASTESLLPDMLLQCLQSLPVDRRMRWGQGDEEFVRPVQWLLMLFNERVIETTLFGIKSVSTTRGHRFHAPAEIQVTKPSSYESLLLDEGRVIASFETRAARVQTLVEEALGNLGAAVRYDASLVDEVAALVEWPVAVTGHFDPEFLSLPREVLISTLKKHQRYFPVEDEKGALMPNFVTIANVESTDPGKIAEGNQRVVTPRLADARFFWDHDQRSTLSSKVERLKGVVFEKGLGSIYEKSQRVATLARDLADTLSVDAELCEQAALLSRADLVTDMVGEFPDLQGIMGGYYAAADGEPEAVASSIRDFYRPRFAGDDLPEHTAGRVLAIADRLDTLAGIFATGKRPKGNKDPFGLRRSALGLARLILESSFEIDLMDAIATAVSLQPVKSDSPELAEDIYTFVTDRLLAYFQDNDDRVSADVFESVYSRHPVSLLDFKARIDAVVSFAELPQADSLAAANKRIGNILRKNDGGVAESIDPALFQEADETVLFDVLQKVSKTVSPLLAKRRYADAMSAMASLREPVDAYFDSVMVMTEDAAIRGNRLALLASIRKQFLAIADISVLGRARA